jgi:hypothetical protein
VIKSWPNDVSVGCDGACNLINIIDFLTLEFTLKGKAFLKRTLISTFDFQLVFLFILIFLIFKFHLHFVSIKIF